MDREWMFAFGLALAHLAFCAYRAAHQSVNLDEAFTFTNYLQHSWHDIYGPYNANNHVLFSILAKLSIKLFGLSELSLRAPSLLGGFLTILGAFCVLRLATASKWIRWLTLLALSLHPLLLDFSVAARGYGLSLGLLVWTIFFAMRRRYALTGVGMGLALAANLNLAFAAAGLVIGVWLAETGPWRERRRNMAVILVLAETLFMVLCFGALRNAHRSDFYVGTPHFSESVRSLLRFSLDAAERGDAFRGDSAVHLAQMVLLPAVAAFIAAMTVLSFIRGKEDRCSLIPAITLTVAAIGLVPAHFMLGLNYPLERTGVHFYVLFGLAWAISADAAPRLRPLNLGFGLLLVVLFSLQLQMDRFLVWPTQDNNRALAEAIDRLSAGREDGSVSITASWPRWASLEFYRVRIPLRQLQPVSWDPKDGFDFYVVEKSDRKLLLSPKLELLQDDARDVAILADRH